MNNKRNVIISLILVLGILTAFITGCAGSGTGDKDTVSKPKKTVVKKEEKPQDDNNTDNKDSEKKEEAKKETENANLVLTMSGDEKREVNIFFSNFCEAFMSDYSKDDRDNYFLISFAFIHNMLNRSGGIEFGSERMGVSAEAVNKTLDKYFGVSVPLESAAPEYGHEWTYEDGMFWTPAASGESYDYFAVVTDMRDMGDGTYKALYDVYYAGYDALTDEYYSYTTEKAESECEYMYSATAVVKPKEYEGKQTYELISVKQN
ncbi:MAG: hypothetical protein J5590_02425 [Clostridia bacterium]|nr:hypothetical protein [Clostridia bacterium]